MRFLFFYLSHGFVYLVDQSLPSNIQPDNYKISIWNCKDNDRANAKVTLLPSKNDFIELKSMPYLAIHITRR